MCIPMYFTWPAGGAGGCAGGEPEGEAVPATGAVPDAGAAETAGAVEEGAAGAVGVAEAEAGPVGAAGVDSWASGGGAALSGAGRSCDAPLHAVPEPVSAAKGSKISQL